MPWWVRDRGTTSTGKASGSGSQKAPDPPPLHSRGIHGCEANAIQGKAAFFADERTAVPGGIIVRDGDKQPGQHGCSHYRLQRGSTYTAGHQAFLKRARRFTGIRALDLWKKSVVGRLAGSQRPPRSHHAVWRCRRIVTRAPPAGASSILNRHAVVR